MIKLCHTEKRCAAKQWIAVKGGFGSRENQVKTYETFFESGKGPREKNAGAGFRVGDGGHSNVRSDNLYVGRSS